LKSIEEKADGAIMPAGLTERLTRKELADLVRFLSEPATGAIRGRNARVRRWRALDRGGHESARQAMPPPRPTIRPAWSPVYSSVSGELPVHSLPGLRATYQQSPGERNTVCAV
jgi:hypothetical protein